MGVVEAALYAISIAFYTLSSICAKSSMKELVKRLGLSLFGGWDAGSKQAGVFVATLYQVAGSCPQVR